MRLDNVIVSKDGVYEYKMYSNGTAGINRYLSNGVDIEIPEQLDGYIVRSLEFASFCGCSTIRTVKMPNTIQFIEKCAFSFCKELYSVTIPEGVERIGVNAFERCPSLCFIYLPKSLKNIGRAAFKDNDHRKITAVVPRDSYAEDYCIRNGLDVKYADDTN